MTKLRTKKRKDDIYKDEDVRADIVFERVVTEGQDTSRPKNWNNAITEYLGALVDYPVLRDADEFLRLHDQWKNSVDEEKRREAHDAIIYGNIRLVLSIALRNTNRGLEIEDLMQEGVFGMMHALDKFSLEAGTKFSTYATWWIRQAISRAIQDMSTSRPYRIPVHMQELLWKVKKAVDSFEGRRRRPPSPVQVLKRLQKKDDANAEKITLKKVKLCLRLIAERYAFVDHAVDEEDGAESSQPLVSPKAVRPLTELMAREHLAHCEARLEGVTKAIDGLEPRLRTIIKLRLGLMPGLPPLTLEEIGQRYGVTRERIRQLEKQGMECLQTQGVNLDMDEAP